MSVYAGPLWSIILAIPLVTAGGLAWYLYESWRAVVVAVLVTLSLLALADHTLGQNRGQNGSGPPSGFTNRP